MPTPEELAQAAANAALDTAVQEQFGRPGLLITPRHTGTGQYARIAYEVALIAYDDQGAPRTYVWYDGAGQPVHRIMTRGGEVMVEAPYLTLSRRLEPARINWPTIGAMSLQAAAELAALHQVAVDLGLYLAAKLGQEAPNDHAPR